MIARSEAASTLRRLAAGFLRPVEIRSSATLQPGLFENLAKFCQLAGVSSSEARLVYAGDARGQRRSGIPVIPRFDAAGNDDAP